ncbi:MAG: glycosyltransferase family 4 protein [Pirellulales bacterium]
MPRASTFVFSAATKLPHWPSSLVSRGALFATRSNLVHLWDNWSQLHIGPILAAQRGVPYLCAVRNPPPQLTWLRRALLRFTLRRATAIVSPSEALRQQCSTMYDAAHLGESWTTIPDVVDIAAPAIDRAALLQSLGFSSDVRLIVTGSRVTVEKSLRDVLFATALLRLVHGDLRLAVCGDGPHMAEVRRFCTLMEIDDITVFAGLHAQATEVIRHAEVYIDAAVIDGPSRSIAEARRLRVPVVCVDTPIRREQVRPDVDALLFPPHDPGELTRRVHELLTDATLRPRLPAAAYEAATEHTATTSVEPHLALYRKAVEAP